MIKEITMYTIICDGCGKDVCDNSEFSAWNDKGIIEEIRMNEDWIEQDEKHYCTDCFEIDDNDNLIIKSDEN